MRIPKFQNEGKFQYTPKLDDLGVLGKAIDYALKIPVVRDVVGLKSDWRRMGLDLKDFGILGGTYGPFSNLAVGPIGLRPASPALIPAPVRSSYRAGGRGTVDFTNDLIRWRRKFVDYLRRKKEGPKPKPESWVVEGPVEMSVVESGRKF